MVQIFESENIRMVQVSDELIQDYLYMVNDVEHVARLIGLSEPVSEEKEHRWIRKKLEEGAPVFSMIEKRTGAFIGNIELMDVSGNTAELGIAITSKMQDNGFGTEAVAEMVRYGMEQLGLERIYLKVFPDNARAIRVYEKCGFREYDRTADDVFMETTRK